MKERLRAVTSTVLFFALALIGGMLVTMAVELIGHRLFPPVLGMSPENPDSFMEYFEKYSPWAIWIVIAAHASGAFISGLIVSLLKPSKTAFNVLVIGLIYTVLGVVNWIQIPHPEWFKIVDTLVYIPMVWLGGQLALKIKGAQNG